MSIKCHYMNNNDELLQSSQDDALCLVSTSFRKSENVPTSMCTEQQDQPAHLCRLILLLSAHTYSLISVFAVCVSV